MQANTANINFLCTNIMGIIAYNMAVNMLIFKIGLISLKEPINDFNNVLKVLHVHATSFFRLNQLARGKLN